VRLSLRAIFEAVLPRTRRPPGGTLVLGWLRRLRLRLAVSVAGIGCVVGAPLNAQAMDARVLTYHNDNARTGQNLNETILRPNNVSPGAFGRLFSYPVDGHVYAQPLYVPNVDIPGRGRRDVVFVATEHDSVYAFDADDPSLGQHWHVRFTDLANGISTISPVDVVESGDVVPEIGITGTPVIDDQTGTLYVVAKTKEIRIDGTHYVQRLHALDIATGAEKFGGPVTIGDTAFGVGAGYSGPAVDGVGAGSVGNKVFFDALRHHNRSGLLLLNGVVYIAWASHGDNSPYHGWLIGYDATTLNQVAVFNTTPNGGLGGVWMAGSGPAADQTGSIYVSTGNGTFDVTASQQPAYGDSVLKLSTGNGVSVADFFTPWNQAALASSDLDLGSGGVVVLPDQPGAHPHLLVTAGKEGKIYLVDRDDLGMYQRCGANCDGVVQVTRAGTIGGGAVQSMMLGGAFDTPAYFNNRVYYQGVGDVLMAFGLSDGRLSSSPVSFSSTPFGYPGSTPSISANGSSNAIVWTLQTDAYGSGGRAILHADDALDLSRQLYSSNVVPADQLDGAVKFAVPTVANGKVYVGTQSSLAVFGLRPTSIAVYRPSTGEWFVRPPSGQSITRAWGCPICGDGPLYADYDGDGTADSAIYRPSTGIWYILRSSDGALQQVQWGASGDVPVTGDFDGDGKADVAVYRPSTGIWYILRSSDGALQQVQWGASDDVLVPGDYDGDGKADVAVYRPSTGLWYIVRSSDGTVQQVQWGIAGDIPVPRDYDGDGKADVAVYRPSTGIWYVLRSSDATLQLVQWGAAGDIPVPRDYDGDGKVDVAVYRPTTGSWYIVRSGDGRVQAIQWGVAGDQPLLQ